MVCSDHPLREAQDICISGVVVMSGIRPKGRVVDQRPEGRTSHGLLYIWEGSVCISPEGEEDMTVGASSLVYIPEGIRYVLRYAEDDTVFVLVNCHMFSPDGKAAWLDEKIRILARDGIDRMIGGIMTKLEMCSAAENPSAAYRRKELVYRLLSVSVGEISPFEKNSPKYAGITRGVLLLQQTYLENIPISEFAAECRVSISSFRSLFTELYGVSPIRYRNRLRINRAQLLLRDSGCTVAEAAYASGFENVGYFCRYYKKITGETPRETKKKDGEYPHLLP